MSHLTTIILAAGEGTRMRSARPKVLHEIGGLPMLGFSIRAAHAAGADTIAAVIGPGHDAVRALVAAEHEGAEVFVQDERRGTAHAVLQARPVLERAEGVVIVLFGDTPFVTAETIDRLARAVEEGAAVAVAGMRPPSPAGYGRLLTDGDRLVAIVEDRDASEDEKRIGLCNGGLMAFDAKSVLALLEAIGDDNAQGEFYLTEAVALANRQGLAVATVEIGFDEVFGVNDRAQLAEAETRFQEGRRRAAMLSGVTLMAPETVFFSHDTRLGQDVTIEPNVFFAPGVEVAPGATIRAFSHLEGATVAEGAVIGPYARLRPGADIGRKARVGNFCEVKKAEIGEGAKVNHLTYIGDATIGAGANIGAGTITCNYDGFSKFRTNIGAGAFVGSNSSLVAPISIGEGAYIGSGSVVTDDVAPDALAVARGRQVEKPGWAAAFRERQKKK
ncbi:bifunctional UDP-N-acetylglucosamine diphosphorylase/glucosamine-1-phosphate N-acetyltransferase GlmU [Afifella sp. IM 167]|uniref:bifunctional UDP-N-acetylglucosamine diphosphorylase/glucosamine-1-phosphate N-acetyltransferase GlmU n=1 Tax=Afifella sp. IM 167 TaxID=2033586 RepID=UPI001CC97DBE|nr:bifunctional UDP-N-acetylglucosamine diphosphorylase/glucosamine-1-phosphate N-acetyltransferase GlmU [Afifella sp. IM 167]MBZ8132469.1 bifunctional N-acetylglucosamine-1-phosphate uridyltransferase/glucosamine-1-phosphate acetyltransferase [Afifella sp. IM 167]